MGQTGRHGCGVGLYGLDNLKTDAAVEILASLGVILLLFEVGLDSSLADLMKVGLSSLLVAVVGVDQFFLW
ncbi:MAG: cation:proton antiporter [Deltaproteobacteria bacterium]|nr:cation:proton antiporter [Deltaproteobacteria bacterium]